MTSVAVGNNPGKIILMYSVSQEITTTPLFFEICQSFDMFGIPNLEGLIS